MLNQVLEWLPNAELLVALLGMVTFVVTYVKNADWRSTAAGRALMYLMLSMIAILGMAFAHLLWGADYIGAYIVRVAIYGAFMASIWRLVAVLYRAQKLNFLSWLGLRRKHPKNRKVEPDAR